MDPGTALAWGLLWALIVGVGLVLCANNDFPHWLLRELSYPLDKEKAQKSRSYRWFRRLFHYWPLPWLFTKETTYPTEWCNAFRVDDDRFVVLHLKKDNLRMYAQLEEWPNYPDKGHFVVRFPEWLERDGKSTVLHGVHKMIIPVEDVGFVEFIATLEEFNKRKEQLAKGEGDPTLQIDSANSDPASKKKSVTAKVSSDGESNGEEES